MCWGSRCWSVWENPQAVRCRCEPGLPGRAAPSSLSCPWARAEIKAPARLARVDDPRKQCAWCLTAKFGSDRNCSGGSLPKPLACPRGPVRAPSLNSLEPVLCDFFLGTCKPFAAARDDCNHTNHSPGQSWTWKRARLSQSVAVPDLVPHHVKHSSGVRHRPWRARLERLAPRKTS